MWIAEEISSYYMKELTKMSSSLRYAILDLSILKRLAHDISEVTPPPPQKKNE